MCGMRIAQTRFEGVLSKKSPLPIGTVCSEVCQKAKFNSAKQMHQIVYADVFPLHNMIVWEVWNSMAQRAMQPIKPRDLPSAIKPIFKLH